MMLKPAVPFSFPGIAEDIGRLGGLLALGLRAAEWQPREKAAVLNLACGRADETGELLRVTCPAAREVFYLGIDLRPVEIAEARSRWAKAMPVGWKAEFRAGDASRTDRMRELPPFDLVFIRHQNFWHDQPTWRVLFENALAGLKPDGVLAITSYFDREHEQAMVCLGQCGGRKLADLRNFESRELPDAPGKSVDKRLALFGAG
jgi:SAM-dependent methyltransferase